MQFDQIKRRQFITLLGGAAAWPLAARAQQSAVPVIGVVNPGSLEASASRAAAFRKGLNETGYIEGQNVTVEYYWLEGQYNRLPSLMADLVGRRVAVITALVSAGALAAKAATTTIPIVFVASENPVSLGLVASLARPDGNMTGINIFFHELVAKRLGLLHDLMPTAVRVAVLVNPANTVSTEATLREIPEAARRLGLQIQVIKATTSREIDAAFATLVRDRADALYITGDVFFIGALGLATPSRDETIRKLETMLRRPGRPIDDEPASDAREIEALRNMIAAVNTKLGLETTRREQFELRLNAMSAALRKTEAELRMTVTERDALRRDMESIEDHIACLLRAGTGDRDGMLELSGRTILYVGARAHQSPRFKAPVERTELASCITTAGSSTVRRSCPASSAGRTTCSSRSTASATMPPRPLNGCVGSSKSPTTHCEPRASRPSCRRSRGCDRASCPVIEPAESCGIVTTDMPEAVMTTRRTWLALLVAAGLAWTAGVQSVSAQGKDVVVFAAASLKNALDEIARQWQRETGKKAVISYAASNTLIKRIEHGAPADIFFSADFDWMDYGQQKDLIRPDTRFNLLGNRLILIAPKDSSVSVNIQPGFDLASLLKGGRLAMGNVDTVPAGKYGKAALEKLGVWDSVKDKIAQAESVRAALMFVSRGQAALGIVYQTDAAADLGVKIVGLFPENAHPPIIYPVALTKTSTNADAQAFLNYLRSTTHRRTFERQGFTVLVPVG